MPEDELLELPNELEDAPLESSSSGYKSSSYGPELLFPLQLTKTIVAVKSTESLRIRFIVFPLTYPKRSVQNGPAFYP